MGSGTATREQEPTSGVSCESEDAAEHLDRVAVQGRSLHLGKLEEQCNLRSAWRAFPPFSGYRRPFKTAMDV